MDQREQVRTKAVVLVVDERRHQIERYGLNEDLRLGFDEPWIRPFSESTPRAIEQTFRADYERYERSARPTWMHLIREEVAELFAAQTPGEAILEASQVAALGISLIEHLTLFGGDLWTPASS